MNPGDIEYQTFEERAQAAMVAADDVMTNQFPELVYRIVSQDDGTALLLVEIDGNSSTLCLAAANDRTVMKPGGVAAKIAEMVAWLRAKAAEPREPALPRDPLAGAADKVH